MTRRDALLLAADALLPAARARAEDPPRRVIGVCEYSYPAHWSAARSGAADAPFRDAAGFLDFCAARGAAGVQVSLGTDRTAASKVRARAEALGAYVEGIVGLPRDPAAMDGLEAALLAAKEAGASVVRTALPGGRRYEAFGTMAEFQAFAARSEELLRRAEPLCRRHRIRLAVENHKDWRAVELAALLRRLDSEWIGACVDTGNNVALLEEPLETVAAVAPYVASSHLKDMAVAEDEQGFLLSEVPLGEGFLDVPKVVAALRKAAPGVRLSLEMITRDPLRVPCLTERYWATMPEVPAPALARALSRAKTSRRPLPRIANLSPAERLKAEDANVRQCLAFRPG